VCRASDDSFADRDAATITDGIRDSRDTRMIVTKRLRSNGFAAVGHVSKTKADCVVEPQPRLWYELA
jgi:hypothetical protein